MSTYSISPPHGHDDLTRRHEWRRPSKGRTRRLDFHNDPVIKRRKGRQTAGLSAIGSPSPDPSQAGCKREAARHLAAVRYARQNRSSRALRLQQQGRHNGPCRRHRARHYARKSDRARTPSSSWHAVHQELRPSSSKRRKASATASSKSATERIWRLFFVDQVPGEHRFAMLLLDKILGIAASKSVCVTMPASFSS